MAEQMIKCPNCGTEFPLTQSITAGLTESIRKEFENKQKQTESRLKQKEAEFEADLKKQKRQIEEQFQAEQDSMRKKAEEQARRKLEIEMKDLLEQNAEKARELAEAKNKQIELMKQQRKWMEEKQQLELQLEQRLINERKSIQDQVTQTVQSSFRLKEDEYIKRMEQMSKTIDELQRKANIGSQQMQGEVLEESLEETLKLNFSSDTIEPVPKGISGADVLQKVYHSKGLFCGTIVWETKNTKNFSEAWIGKLKDDMQHVKGDIAVLVSFAMPDRIKSFALDKGVWLVKPEFALPLAVALRESLIKIAQARNVAVGKNQKMEMLYLYLSGEEFRQRMEALVNAFKTLKSDLDAEKRTFIKLWSKREKQIEKLMTNTSGMYGDLQGIIGATLPELKAMDIEQLASGENDDEV